MVDREHLHGHVSAIFSAIDRNKDGRLSFTDLRLGFHELGISMPDDELKDMMNEVDQDGDGAINFSEMLTIMIRMHKQSRESQNLQKVFEVMDKDGNKRISKTELKKALKLYGNKKVSASELDKIMIEVDFDNDGYISFVEFANCVHLFK
ncbi:neo-calmodulin-like isoform X2 [Bolinopsis microptera]|uniref:neo-calmodulin-like isoform X2 n=1 Tax=Bolinopsis microptera TaxID=2820187 RepID=UPI00307AEA54